MNRTVAVAIVCSLSACSGASRTVPLDRALERSQAANARAATTYPTPVPCKLHDQLEFAVAFGSGSTKGSFNGTDTVTYDGTPTQSRAYVTVTSCRGALATVATASWGWNTSAADPDVDCPGLTIVPPSNDYIYATGAPASCTPDNVMDSIRSDGEVDNSAGVGASLSIAPDRTTSMGGRYPYLTGFAGITSFGGYPEATGAWRIVALDANGRNVGERTLYELAYP